MQKSWDSVKDRLGLMYGLGTVPGEVDRCLNETRKRLVAAGAKADNLPVGLERQVRFLGGLQPKASAIVRDWFKKNSKFECLGDAVVALESLQSVASNLDVEGVNNAWRTLMRAYALGESVPGMDAFLAGANVNPMTPTAGSLENGALATMEVTDEDAELCIAVAEGKLLPAPLRPLPSLISGMLASLRGDERTASERSAELSANSSPLVKKLGLTLSALLLHRHKIPRRASARKLQPYVRGMIDNSDNVPFIGIVKRVLPQGHIFVSLAAMSINGKWTEISPAQAGELFPTSGDATAAPHSIPGAFVEGEIGIWTAELKSPEKSTRYVITQHLGRVYEVVPVPYSSQEPDEVRRWIIDAYKPYPGGVPVFHLSDGVAIRLPGDLSDPRKFNFDMPLDCYCDLEVIELGSSRSMLAPHLPPGLGKFHCEPSGTLIKRLFKQAKEFESVPALTKPQLQALANFANLNSSAPDLSAHTRALEGLGNVEDAKAFLDETIGQILELPEINGRIDLEVAKIAQKYEAAQNKVKAEIDELTNKRQLLDAEIESKKAVAHLEVEKLKKAGRQQEVELERRIKNTFDKAAEGGLETLANAALLKALFVGNPVVTPKQPAQEVTTIPTRPQNTDFQLAFSIAGNGSLSNRRALSVAVAARAEHSGLSETMILSAVALASVWPAIGFTGQRARKTIAELAALISDGVLCEVAVSGDMFNVSDLMNAPALVRSRGLGWPVTLGAFLEVQASAGRPSVIELRGANRAPPESLLFELAEPHGAGDGAKEIYWRDPAGGLHHVSLSAHALFALTFVSGKSVFPIQGELAACMPILHTDGTWGDEIGPTGEPAINPTAVSAEFWSTLSKVTPSSGLTYGALQAQAIQAAEVLGFSEPKAQAIVSIALLAGRSASAALLSEVERLAPELVQYTSELSEGAAARAIKRIFESEYGANDE